MPAHLQHGLILSNVSWIYANYKYVLLISLCNYRQLFEVFDSINNQSLEKLNGIVRNATWICTFVYIAVGFFGYVAYCTHSFSGNIRIITR